MRIRLGWLIVALAVTVIGGCSSDCEDACEGAKDCPFSGSYLQGVPCDEACDFQEAEAERAGCVSQWESYNACAADSIDDGCQLTGSTCAGESLAWSMCMDAAIP